MCVTHWERHQNKGDAEIQLTDNLITDNGRNSKADMKAKEKFQKIKLLN